MGNRYGKNKPKDQLMNKTYTAVSITQDNNSSEEGKVHSEKNWQMVLEGIKKLLEN